MYFFTFLLKVLIKGSVLYADGYYHTQFKYGPVTKTVKCLLALEMCATERFLMDGPQWENSETKGYKDLHNYTRPVPPNIYSQIPTTGPILRHNLAENHTSF